MMLNGKDIGKKRNVLLVIGGIGLLLAAGYLLMAFQLSFGQINRPGPGVFPVIAGVLLVLASLSTIWEGSQTEATVQIELPAGADRKRLLSLLAILAGYFISLPWLGLRIGSTFFCILLMRVLSDLSWTRIVVYSLVIAFSLHTIFVLLLKVPMPSGVLGF